LRHRGAWDERKCAAQRVTEALKARARNEISHDLSPEYAPHTALNPSANVQIGVSRINFLPWHPHAFYAALRINIYDGLAHAIPKTLGISRNFNAFAPFFA
jgi:hypothetical protein